MGRARLAVALMPLHRASRAAAAADSDGVLRVEVEERPDPRPGPEPDPRARARIPRGRGRDPRAARRRRAHPRLRALHHRAGRAGRHRRLLPGPHLRAEAPAPGDPGRGRAAEARASRSSGSGWPSCRCASASRTTSTTAPRSSSASISCAARWTPSARSWARTTARSPTSTGRRSPRRACRTPVRAARPARAGPPRAHGGSNAESSMIRTYLDWLLAVPWDKRSEERLDPVHAREVLDADHEGLDDVKRRITEYLAVRKLRARARPDREPPLRASSSP